MHDVVPDEHRGDVWPAAEPGRDRVLYGHVAVTPDQPVEARSLQTFALTYTCGRFGMDGGGGLKIVFRFTGDWGLLQGDEPDAINYVSATNSRGHPMRVSYDDVGHTRPWYQALRILMPVGHLDEGDTITVLLGDTSQGSPGMAVQSCAEQDFRFTTLVDVAATNLYIPVTESPVVPIVAGEPEHWHAVLPTLRRPGEPFRLGLRAEDRWGNPTPLARADLMLKADMTVDGLPGQLTYGPGEDARVLDDLRVDDQGVLRITVEDGAGRELAVSNPLIIRENACAGWWADLHGQSGESVGINTARHYFGFSRDVAFLDACGHQANDFQINNTFWTHLNSLTAEFNDEGRFITYPGYEWSANTHLGGDRNVYFRTEGRQIHRSSHALLPDRSDIDTDANDASALFEALKDEDAVVFAHIGGRWADLTRGHDGRTETAMEIHSAWGTFEWLMEDAFDLGLRVGVVANSDGHKGRPGASHPGASEFVAYGGLTCLLASDLTRDALFFCLRKRRHFATTGSRMHLDLNVTAASDMTVWDRDPAVFDDAVSVDAVTVEMGDIVSVQSDAVSLRFAVEAGVPIEKVEVRNGKDTVACLRPYTVDEVGSRIRVLLSGAERRGKGSRSRWNGTARLDGATIRAFAPVSAWNPELPCEQVDATTAFFRSRTAGNMMGFDLTVDETSGAMLYLDTGYGEVTVALSDIGHQETVFEQGGLARKVRVLRAPDENPHRAMRGEIEVPIKTGRDNPIWICVTTEDGHQAWSSPVYVVP
ncbi:MAG: DUF3604 domain-containing protein [Rhodospirillaceae bacterium]|nr:DUF3604 domain-containing protein [Rhodospirillaceae bacterium]|tara:strand:- start:6050 stop:8338 length:2289 start_codon:yes stop_codon:yes gene_type:complete